MQTSANMAITDMVADPACPACRGRGILWDLFGGWSVCSQCGGKGTLPPQYDRLAFDYAFATLTLTDSGDTLETSLQFDDDAPFEQVAWTYRESPDNDAKFDCPVLVQDQSTGWQMANGFIDLVAFAGPGASPFPLLVAHIWHPSSQVLLQVQDVANGQLQVCMKGYKLYPPGTLNPQQPAQPPSRGTF